jgi:hypothetical protein
MRRKLYANMQSAYLVNGYRDEPCEKCGGKVFEARKRYPALYIADPPYKRKNRLTEPFTVILYSQCGDCRHYLEASDPLLMSNPENKRIY